MEDKLGKLKKILEISSRDTISAKEIEQFLVLVLSTIKTERESFRSLSDEQLSTINEKVNFIDGIKDDFKSLFVGELNEAKKLLKELSKIKATHGRDGMDGLHGLDGVNGQNGLDGKDGKDGSPDTRTQIVEKINTGKENDLKIERKQIEGLDNFVEQKNLDRAISILDQRTQFLINKRATSTNSGGGTWGSITGTLSDQTDLQSALDAKQDTLISGTNIKTINGNSLLSSGDLVISGASVSFGTDNQIPFMNAGGTDFDYSANFTFDNDTLLVKSASTVGMTLETTGASEQAHFRFVSNAGRLDMRYGGTASGFSDYWFMYDANNATTVMSVSSHASGRVVALGYGQTVGTQANSALNIASTSVVFNESGLDMDFRMESDTHTDAFFLDGANGEITLGAYGVGTFVATPVYGLGVDATGKIVEYSPGAGTVQVFNEVPTGAINTSNTIYTTANNFSTGTTRVYLNGVRQILSVDYTETGADEITFTAAPFTGDSLIIDYQQ
jgi:hypothetical protein